MDSNFMNYSKEVVRLRPSSSARWFHCTPSAAAEANVEDADTDFKLEGTLAHALAAKKLKEKMGEDTSALDKEIAELKDRYYSQEMQEHVDDYVRFVTDLAGEGSPLNVEIPLTFSPYIPGGEGTADAVIIYGDTLHIVDLKYGRGVKVSAEGNTQMLIYALGAYDLYEVFGDIRRVRMTIYQPRLRNTATSEISVDELLAWGQEMLQPLAAVAARGLGARKAGKWCKFCKVKADCVTLALESQRRWFENPDSEKLTIKDLADLKPYLKDIQEWATSIDERALDLAMKGTKIPGHKLVPGRSTRKILDTAGAAAALTGAGVQDIYKPQELKTLTALEKEVGKKRLGEILGELITRKEGAPTLVAESDIRRPLSGAEDFDDLPIPIT